MSAFEFTLLKCFVNQGLVSEVSPVHRRIEADETLIEAVMEARRAIQSNVREHPPLELDRVLGFAGQITPQLIPTAFAGAARQYPELVAGKLARYFPMPVSPPPKSAGKKTKGASAQAIRYRTLTAGAGETDGLELMTLLVKDHFSDSYSLEPLLVDRTTAAASMLRFLAEMTDGRFQPIAAFAGHLAGFLPSNPTTRSSGGRNGKAITDPLGRVLAVVLDEALVRQGLLNRDPQAAIERGLDWLAGWLQSHSVVALVTDLPFGEFPIVHAIRSKLTLSTLIAEPISPTEPILNLAMPSKPTLFVLPMTAYPRLADPERLAFELASGEHAALIACESLRSLPEPLRRQVETSITLPRMDRPLFERLFAELYGIQPPDTAMEDDGATWLRYVQPPDLARVARAESDPQRAYVMLQHRIGDRLRRITPRHGPSLAELHGLGEARTRAELLIADIQAALAGRLSWKEVDRGMLLVGPPGCGKTTLARAIAKDCGIHFLDCSAARWQMAGYLNDHLAAMARDFQEARRFAPSILFIDEIDSIGNRERFSGNNASYNTQVVNALLAEMQGFSDREKVILIAATNNLANVDPALRRAGRLDRVIEVTLPTIEALEKIFDYYLSLHGAGQGEVSDITLRPLAEAAFGRTGADVSLAVRGALRRARMAGRPLQQEDLLAELFNRPLDLDFVRPLGWEGMGRIALHEAGHALLRLRAGGALGGIAYLSIVPRPDGTLGFVSLRPNPDVSILSRRDYLTLLDITLGGRAAEELRYGAEEVSAGAGGNEASDLAKATEIALDMVCRLGLGRELRLRWRASPTEQDIEEAEILVAEAYDRAKQRLSRHWELVERIAQALVDRQEMSGEELHRLVGGELDEAAQPAEGSP